MDSTEYDLIVIGSGPSGYPCALRAQELGLKSLLIEKEMFGGTCLHVGCIPSKTLLYGTELTKDLKHIAPGYGLHVTPHEIQLPELMKKKNEVIHSLSAGLEASFNFQKIARAQGTARFCGKETIEVISQKGTQKFTAKNFVIATGSYPIELPFLPFDEKSVVSSTGALSLEKVPKNLVVVGGGVIGCELASVWSRLGSHVTIVELLPELCTGMEGAISKALEASLKKQGINILIKSKVVTAEESGNKHVLKIEKEGKTEDLVADVVLVAIGRRPNIQFLALDKAGISLTQAGFIQVDSRFCTSNPKVFAVGDVIGGPMLAHKGWQEGFCVAEMLSGKDVAMSYITVPNVVYTSPEAASVGLTTKEARELGFDVISKEAHMRVNPRAKASSHEEGLAVIVACAKTHVLLGMHLFGPYASEIISFAMLALEKKATLEDVALLPFAHPTYAEIIREACFKALKIESV